MRSIFAIVFVFGLAAASQNSLFRPGREYTFKYEGRLLSGLPELATHYSGVGIRATVKVQVQEENLYRIQVVDGQYTKINQQVQVEGTDLSKNWRMLPLPEFVELPSMTAQHLKETTLLRLNPTSKTFESLTVSGEEPVWSVNFKKSLAALFIVNTVEPYSGVSENMLERRSSEELKIRSGDPNVSFWKVQEESLEGLCDVTYQINELPPHMVRENRRRVSPLPKACGGSSSSSDIKFYEIVRSRDVSSCSLRSSSYLWLQPGSVRCPRTSGNCQGQSTRSAVTRFAACGSGRGDLNIQSVVSEGEVEVDMVGYDAEKFVSGSKMNLTLIQEGPIGSKLPEPSSPVQTKTLAYDMTLHSSSSSSSYTSLPTIVSKITGKKVPEGIAAIKVNLVGKDGKFNPDNVASEVVDIIMDIVRGELLHNADQEKKDLPVRLLQVSRAMAVLQKSKIQQIYTQLKTKVGSSQEQMEIMRNVFFDTLVMSGTNPAVEFFGESILNKEVKCDIQAASLLTFLPSYVTVPTEELFHGLFDLVSGSHLRNERSQMVYNQAVMSLTKLVNKACIAEDRLTTYPAAVYGEQCYPESEIVVGKIIPYIQSQLSSPSTPSEIRTVLIVALGQLSHKNGLGILLPIMQGTPLSGSGSGMNPDLMRMERFLALFSVSSIGSRYPGLTEPVLFALLNNQAEATELRIAAFNALLSLNPSEGYLHRVASLTWRESDQQLLRVIDSALYSLSERRQVESTVGTVYSTSLPRKAYLVYPLIRRPSGKFPSSSTVIDIDYLHELGVLSERVVSWTSTAESYFPVNYYHKTMNLLNKYQVVPVEYAQRVRGGETLIQSLVEMLVPGGKHISREEYEEKVKNTQLSPEWKEVIEKLKLKVKESDVGEFAFFLNLFESAPIFQTLKSQTPGSLKEKLSKVLKQSDLSLKQLCGEHRLNFQRVLKPLSASTSHPSELGLPFLMEHDVPLVLSFKGRVNIDCHSGSIVPKMEIKTSQLFETSLVAQVGTVLPFTDEVVTAGVEETVSVNLPTHFDVSLDTEEQMFKLSLYPGTLPRATDLLFFRMRPFTLVQKLNSVSPLTRSTQMRQIRSPTEPKHKLWNFGQGWLGVHFELSAETESRFVDFRSIFEKLHLFNYSFANVLRFPFITSAISEKLTPSLRKHIYRLTLDPSYTRTGKVELQLRWGVATKLKGEPIKYNALKVALEEAEQSYPQWKKLLPFKYESKNIGEISKHPRRQQMLKDIIEKSNLQSGHGWMVDCKLNLVSSSRVIPAFHYVIRHAFGTEDFLKQKWNIVLEKADSTKVLCVNGHLNVPSSPLWKISDIRNSHLQFSYENVIGYGHGCTESKIIVSGSSQVSQQQKSYSEQSSEAKILRKIKEQKLPMSELSEVADKVRAQASTFDEASFTIKYENITKKVKTATAYVSEYLKAFFWPYLVISQPNSSGSSSSNFEVRWNLRYDELTNTVNVKIMKPTETIAFQHIRMPSILSYFLPMNAVSLNQRVAQKSHSSLYPVCQSQGRWLKSFSNETTEAEIDGCFHLLAADCSYRKHFAVLARNVTSGSDSPKEIKVLIGKSQLLLTPVSELIKVKVNESEVTSELKSQGHYAIKDSKKDYIGDIYLSKDGVITLKLSSCDLMLGLPAVVIKHDGRKTEVKVTPMYQGKLCGLCGDLSGLKLSGLVGPQRCSYSKPELLTASYRVSLSSQSCRAPLPSDIKSQLDKETSECLKVRELPTYDIVSAFRGQVGPCSRHSHQVIEETGRVCFSRRPVVACSPLCAAADGGSMIEKEVEFACMPRGRVAERYSEKIRRGVVIPELQAMPAAFTSKLTVPRSCVPVHRQP